MTMSIDSLRKQAKNLKRLLPEFLAQHGGAPLSLAACQELVARLHGYPHWHAATVRVGGSSLPSGDSTRAEATPAPLADHSSSALYTALDDFEHAQRQKSSGSRQFIYGIVPDTGAYSVIEFPISEVALPEDEAATLLHDEVEHAYRLQHDPSATLILNVQSATVPEYTIRAVERFHAFGINLVVVHGRDCSLDAPDRFPHRLMVAIAAVGGRGAAWHPVKNKRVQFTPQ